MVDQDKFMRMMKRVHAALTDENDVVETDVALIVLASSLGYVLGRGLDEDAPLDVVYAEIIQKIDMARTASRSFDVAYNAIEKAKH